MYVDALTDAEGLFDSISSFKFIMSLVIAQKALGYTRSATVLLQDRAIDIVKGYHEVDLLKATIQHERKNIDEYIQFRKSVAWLAMMNLQEPWSDHLTASALS